MNTHVMKPLIGLMVFVLLVGLACSLTGGSEPTTQPADDTPAPVVQETEAVTAPAEETEESNTSSGAVTNREDVEKAVIRIVSQGTFVDPEYGAYEGIGSGSGFIIDPSGIAVTNNHVVTGSAMIKVYFNGSDKAYNAKILGTSECSDLAVIDIEGEGFPYLEWYDGEIKVGMEVWSAGYPLGDPEYSLHDGIISKAKADGESSWASVDSVVEHDATINPGNSGGPLINEDGQVVGVNYASSGAAVNQFFAITKAEADDVLSDLIDGKDVNSIGINGTAVVSDDGTISGIWVSSVASGSPADKSGLEAGDILYQVEGVQMGRDGTMADYCDILRTHQPEDTLDLTILRFNTGEYLEGQLNGRELEVVDTFDGSSTGDDTTTDNSADDGTGYYLEEFDRTLDDWSWWLMSGEEDDFGLFTENGKLTFDIENTYTWVYAEYDTYYYQDVRLDVETENRGLNNNNVALLCRINDDGWYEFNIANNGEYWIYRYDEATDEYVTLWSGGSTLINMGQGVNDYTIICSGNDLTLGINGVEVKTVSDNTLDEGYIGLSVSSFNVYPIMVDFEYLNISLP